MTKYYEPRQDKDGKWKYARAEHDGVDWNVTPIGNCAAGCSGHDTMEGAWEHQVEFEAAKTDFKQTEELSGVEVLCIVEGCDGRTTDTVQIDMGDGSPRPVALCKKHRNAKHLAKALKKTIRTEVVV